MHISENSQQRIPDETIPSIVDMIAASKTGSRLIRNNQMFGNAAIHYILDPKYSTHIDELMAQNTKMQY